MNKAFSNFNWSNYPSLASPLNETNLNKINRGLNEVDNRVVEFDTTKANKADLLTDVVNVSYNGTTGIWTFTRRNGTTFTYDQNIEKIPVSFQMSPQGVITMTTADGTQYTADIGSMIKTISFIDSSIIDFTETVDSSGNKTVTATIKAGSITEDKLQANYLADITIQAQSAAASAQAALQSESYAEADALLAKSYAVGNSGVRQGEDTDNAKYYKEQAVNSANTASQAKTDTQALYNDTVTKYNETVGIKNQTEQLFTDAEDTVNTIIQNALDESVPSVYVDLDTGELYYQSGTFNLMVDENPSSTTMGDLLWEVR